jgi:hypothetical protein
MQIKMMTPTSKFSTFQTFINIRTMMAARQSITISQSSRLKSWSFPGPLNQVSYFCLSVCPSVCPSVWLSVCTSVCLSVCLSVRLQIFPSAHLSVCTPVRLHICPSVRLCIYPSDRLSVHRSVCKNTKKIISNCCFSLPPIVT